MTQTPEKPNEDTRPEREKLSQKLEESLKRGIADAKAGRVQDLGSFAKYLDE